jgi:hypothetical protein
MSKIQIPNGFVRIKKFENYFINNKGQVGSIMKGFFNPIKWYYNQGIPVYNLKNSPIRKQKSVLRLLYENFIGDIPNNLRAMPKDGNYLNFDLNNIGLFPCSMHEFNRPYEVDHNYFNKIDSHDKAYIFGIMCSDGCVSYKDNTISLSSNDWDLLKFYKSQLKCNKKLDFSLKIPKSKKISYASPQHKKDLINLGCTPRKSLTLDFPSFEQVPLEYMWSFILGMFDGDGCISGKRQTQVKFLSSTKFCQGLIKFLNSQNIKTCALTSESYRYKPETSYFHISAKSINDLRDKMYKNVSFCLKRKKERFYNANV